MRALQARQMLCKKREQLTSEEELAIQSPLRKLKSMFPNTPLGKHSPLDILITAPSPKEPRSLIVRDLGSVQSDWLAREFVLTYFEGKGLSPPVSLTLSAPCASRTYPGAAEGLRGGICQGASVIRDTLSTLHVQLAYPH